jgi:hypothetical protein
MKIGLILILSIFALTGIAEAKESWQCRNDLEITCENGKCDAKTEDGFTPMSVNIDDTGAMNVCAYSGCWTGSGQVFTTQKFLTLNASNLKFSTSDDRANISITLDRTDNVAIIKAGSFAQPLVCQKNGQSADVPTFDDYKVKVSSTQPKPIKFSGNRDARMFRTRLREARKDGVNFAGHFIFATWGCGTSCLQGAIINTKTGVVYFPKELGGMSFGPSTADIAGEPLQYKKDSKLFILIGTAGNSKDYTGGTYYLVWQGTKFKQVKFVESKRR